MRSPGKPSTRPARMGFNCPAASKVTSVSYTQGWAMDASADSVLVGAKSPNGPHIAILSTNGSRAGRCVQPVTTVSSNTQRTLPAPFAAFAGRSQPDNAQALRDGRAGHDEHANIRHAGRLRLRSTDLHCLLQCCSGCFCPLRVRKLREVAVDDALVEALLEHVLLAGHLVAAACLEELPAQAAADADRQVRAGPALLPGAQFEQRRDLLTCGGGDLRDLQAGQPGDSGALGP